MNDPINVERASALSRYYYYCYYYYCYCYYFSPSITHH